jgi:hypothetical protein
MSDNGPQPESAGQGRNVLQLLALFLLLLSFFILLDSRSSFEATRAQNVIGSLTETFGKRTARDFEEPFVAAGNRAALERFQARLRAAFLSAVPSSTLDASEGGKLMQITLSADELFARGAPALRTDRDRLVHEIAAALAQRPADLRFELEAVLSPGRDGEGAARERAGTLAEALVERGAPKDAVATGLGQGSSGAVRLRFYIRDANEGRLSFAPVTAAGGR